MCMWVVLVNSAALVTRSTSNVSTQLKPPLPTNDNWQFNVNFARKLTQSRKKHKLVFLWSFPSKFWKTPLRYFSLRHAAKELTITVTPNAALQMLFPYWPWRLFNRIYFWTISALLRQCSVRSSVREPLNESVSLHKQSPFALKMVCVVTPFCCDSCWHVISCFFDRLKNYTPCAIVN